MKRYEAPPPVIGGIAAKATLSPDVYNDCAVQEEILKRLDQIEREENVSIFYACESGSRAWGFESTDSDWDVRFLYVHPRVWYLSVDV
ncbi:MAG TPA: nucleotidyltransferase domain-containing protein, partial [Pyrinomonadaceae bacterium]